MSIHIQINNKFPLLQHPILAYLEHANFAIQSRGWFVLSQLKSDILRIEKNKFLLNYCDKF
jgi:hypothetical protein